MLSVVNDKRRSKGNQIFMVRTEIQRERGRNECESEREEFRRALGETLAAAVGKEAG